MRTKLLALLLAGMALAVTSTPAEAHTPAGTPNHTSATSYYICSATRTTTLANQVDTSRPVAITTSKVTYSCTGHSHTSASSGSVCSWRAIQPKTGAAYRELGSLHCAPW